MGVIKFLEGELSNLESELSKKEKKEWEAYQRDDAGSDFKLYKKENLASGLQETWEALCEAVKHKESHQELETIKHFFRSIFK